MARQLTRHRLAVAFAPPARVSAKSGSLLGVYRNEIGVIEYPDGRWYTAAVFTRTTDSNRDEGAVNAAIGRAAARAVAMLAPQQRQSRAFSHGAGAQSQLLHIREFASAHALQLTPRLKIIRRVRCGLGSQGLSLVAS
jgi:Ser/Thr protein kinase RdoA (MazF antagonist)